MDLSIIIVSWNSKNKLKKNLTILYNNKVNFNFEVFVVDNNSHDDTPKMVKKYFPQVRLIKNEINLGFAKANNQALKKITAQFILLLNPDMEIQKDTLQKMRDWMIDHPTATVAGCKLKTKDGQVINHIRRFPKILDQLAIVLKLPHIFPKIIKKYIIDDFNYNQSAKVDSIRGSFMFINWQKLCDFANNPKSSLPYFDEQFFIWFEEVDLCRQIKKAGGEIWYTPVTECIDLIGQSFKQVNRLRTQKYFRDSQLKYFKKWKPGWQYRLLYVVWFWGLFISRLTIKGRIKN